MPRKSARRSVWPSRDRACRRLARRPAANTAPVPSSTRPPASTCDSFFRLPKGGAAIAAWPTPPTGASRQRTGHEQARYCIGVAPAGQSRNIDAHCRVRAASAGGRRVRYRRCASVAITCAGCARNRFRGTVERRQIECDQCARESDPAGLRKSDPGPYAADQPLCTAFRRAGRRLARLRLRGRREERQARMAGLPLAVRDNSIEPGRPGAGGRCAARPQGPRSRRAVRIRPLRSAGAHPRDQGRQAQHERTARSGRAHRHATPARHFRWARRTSRRSSFRRRRGRGSRRRKP